MKKIALTVMSNGGGQDSTTIIHKLLYDRNFYARHVKGDLLIVGSNTGDEHEHTYKNIQFLKNLCKEKGVEFFWLNPEDGFHSEAWRSLTDQYKRNNNIGSAAFRQTCTDNLKVKVVDRFVEHWIAKKYYSGNLISLKRTYHQFYKDHGSIRLILGFAKGEETRTSNGNKFDDVWKKKVVKRYYPLIIDGLDRQACIDYNTANILRTVWPSNCMRCFYQSEQEILWLYRFNPQAFWEWVEMEKAKLEKYKDREKNVCVYGKNTLQQKLAMAIEKYGHWSDDQLNEYKLSHGHCMKSKY